MAKKKIKKKEVIEEPIKKKKLKKTIEPVKEEKSKKMKKKIKGNCKKDFTHLVPIRTIMGINYIDFKKEGFLPEYYRSDKLDKFDIIVLSDKDDLSKYRLVGNFHHNDGKFIHHACREAALFCYKLKLQYAIKVDHEKVVLYSKIK